MTEDGGGPRRHLQGRSWISRGLKGQRATVIVEAYASAYRRLNIQAVVRQPTLPALTSPYCPRLAAVTENAFTEWLGH